MPKHSFGSGFVTIPRLVSRRTCEKPRFGIGRQRSKDLHPQEKIGCLYQYGHGVDQDLAEAVHWYELAARQGNQDAQYTLGCCYYDGDGVAEDWDKAEEWFRLAAAEGSPDAKQALEELGAT